MTGPPVPGSPVWLPRAVPRSRRSPDLGSDNPRTLQGLGMCGVHLQVVDHALVDNLRLRQGHPLDPVAPGELAARGDRAVAPDGDPQYVQPGQNLLPPLLGHRSAEEDLIDDD